MTGVSAGALASPGSSRLSDQAIALAVARAERRAGLCRLEAAWGLPAGAGALAVLGQMLVGQPGASIPQLVESLDGFSRLAEEFRMRDVGTPTHPPLGFGETLASVLPHIDDPVLSAAVRRALAATGQLVAATEGREPQRVHRTRCELEQSRRRAVVALSRVGCRARGALLGVRCERPGRRGSSRPRGRARRPPRRARAPGGDEGDGGGEADVALLQGNRAVGAQVRTRRQTACWTQIEVAAPAGCALSSVFNLEAGLVPRRSRVLPAIRAVPGQAGRNLAECGQEGADGR